MSITFIIALALGALILGGGAVAYLISIYNSMVQVKNNVEKAWKNIDVLLQQRHDELPKLIDVCKGYMRHEKSLLESIVKLRVGYNELSDIDQKISRENKLNDLMRQLQVVWEQYPDLKASQNFLQMQQRVSELEESIADRREFFNDSVNIYNIQIERFPEVLVAKKLNYQKHAYLHIPEEKKSDVVMEVG
ncbi:MAG: LemA family protein [Desulfobulbaceae bacterium]|nr:LemA family protein [Desulfobulbaceae bacterium]